MTAPEGRDEEADGDAAGAGEKPRFERLDEPRADRTREWELFVREEREDTLRHAGSVSAPTAEVAREQATTLFGFAAETLWLCPADETVRLVAEDVALSDRAEAYDGEATGSERTDGGRAES